MIRWRCHVLLIRLVRLKAKYTSQHECNAEHTMYVKVQGNNSDCYIARLSLDKMSSVIDWFLVTCPWSNSNVSRPGYNCAVVACMGLCLFVFALWLLKGKSRYITKHFKVWSLRKLVSFVFPRVLMFTSTSSWETSGLSVKQNCFPRDHTLTVYYCPWKGITENKSHWDQMFSLSQLAQFPVTGSFRVTCAGSGPLSRRHFLSD